MRSFLIAAVAAVAAVGLDREPAVPGPDAAPQAGTGTGVRRVPGGEAVESYTWAGAGGFLVFRDKQRVTAARKNADGGEEEQLPGLSKRLKESLAKPDDANLITGVSADGAWLLWWPLGGKHFHAATLDGARHCSWPRPSPFLSPQWLSGGHQWAVSQDTNAFFGPAEGATPNLLVFDADSPAEVKTVKVVARFSDGNASAPKRKFTDFNTVGSSNNGPVRATGFQYTLAGAEAVRRDVTIDVPASLTKDASVGVPKASPDGERLVWMVEPKGSGAVGFHVSDLAGGGMRKVADFTGGGAEKPNFGLFDPRWSADGKRLSFLADGRLYTFAPAGG
jgi:hypothetical protein